MIFFLLSQLSNNIFSNVNRQAFVTILGTFIWTITWQVVKTYSGANIIMKAIHSGFYYLVLADLYNFIMYGAHRNFEPIQEYSPVIVHQSPLNTEPYIAELFTSPPAATKTNKENIVDVNIVDIGQNDSGEKLSKEDVDVIEIIPETTSTVK